MYQEQNSNIDDIKKALDGTREKRLELEAKVAEARKVLEEADQELRTASNELMECYTKIATLKSMKEAGMSSPLETHPTESQYSGEVPALYEDGFAVFYWG